MNPLPALAFELERGGEPDPLDPGPVVWPVAGPLRAADLARRFAQAWAAWYGPVLAPHAAAIGRLLADEAGLAQQLGGLPGTEHPQVWGGPAALVAADGLRWAVALPVGWAVPVVRRRGRRLRIVLPAGAAAGWWAAAAPLLPPRRWRGWRLDFELHGYWGARAEMGEGPGSVVWQPQAWRSDLMAGGLAPAAAAESSLERRLEGGVGLLVVQPWLCVEAVPPGWGASTAQAAGSAWRGLRRWAAGSPVRVRALSRPAQRHAASPQRQHVLLLPPPGATLQQAFGALMTEGRDAGTGWSGLPLLDDVATWGCELAGDQTADDLAQQLATALTRDLIGHGFGAGFGPADAAPGAAAPGGRIVLLAQGSAQAVADRLVAGWRQRWAARGWRLGVLLQGAWPVSLCDPLATGAADEPDRLVHGDPLLPGAAREPLQRRLAHLLGRAGSWV